MRKLFSVRKRVIGLGLMSALVLALAVLGALWGMNQTASANGSVSLVHVNPDGTDFTGNPLCPAGGPAWDDCNNITSQNHIIRTQGYDAATMFGGNPIIEGVGTVLDVNFCGNMAEVTGRDLWGDDDGDGLVDEDPDECLGSVDDDFDGFINDGCPRVGDNDEVACADALDDDGDGAVNDGCIAVGVAEPVNNDAMTGDTSQGEDGPGDPRDGEVCIILHSAEPGETRVVLEYAEPAADPETGVECGNNIDDDGDTAVNDGCPTEVAELVCDDALDDAEDPVADGLVNDGCPANGDPEEGAECTDAVDSDDDGDINDGCPAAVPEVACGTDTVDDDGDTVVNDGCPSVGGDILSYTTGAVVKEWDSLIDTVILKEEPYDVDNDGDIDADDQHLLDRQGVTQDHEVVLDEAEKGIRAVEPVHLIEIVHGEHDVLINSDTVTLHHPTQGAVILATIESERGCTFFTDATASFDFGTAMTGRSNGAGRFVGPQIAPATTQPPGYTMNPFSNNGPDPFLELPLLDVYVDTICEEQATIHFDVGYPGPVGSLRVPAHEEIHINWVTIEMAKQPQIRWAGEQIVLAKRWALPDDWYPNPIDDDLDGAADEDPWDGIDNDGDGFVDEDDINPCPLYSDESIEYDPYYVVYIDKSGPGALEGGYIDSDGDGFLDALVPASGGSVVAEIDKHCVSKAMYDSEDPGEADIEAKLIKVEGGMPVDAQASINGNGTGLPEPPPGIVVNKHAFLVWYIKIYQVKLTNVVGDRELHNEGDWTPGDPVDTSTDVTAEERNVSADALVRVRVKGWFTTADHSARGDICIDMDGDGNGLEGDEATPPGEPYAGDTTHTGCTDLDDEMIPGGHWVLPDDLEKLAGANPSLTKVNWDVMQATDGDVSDSLGMVGPKSTLDSHDNVARAWIPCLPGICPRKTIAPDGVVDVSDALMPPLKIRASIVDPVDATDNDADTLVDEDAGFLKEALKSQIYTSGSNLYYRSMIPAEPEIPPFVNNGGYDWDSWECRIEDANIPSDEDPDADGLPNFADNCDDDYNPNQFDLDWDGRGDACDDDADDDQITNEGGGRCDDGIDNDADTKIDGDDSDCDDACPYDWTLQGGELPDADGDGVPDACDDDSSDASNKKADSDQDGVDDASDNCPTIANADQLDSDDDDEGNACDADPLNAPIVARAVLCPDQVNVRGLALGPYEFWTIFNKRTVAEEPEPWYIEIYTDNRGEGMFFVNGDFNLSFDDCVLQSLFGAWYCEPGDVVGMTDIVVIGDYPYFRKHPAVQSNTVTKTWTWGGFKDVDGVRIDATHIAIIASLKDRDGYCKWDAPDLGSVEPGDTIDVTFSPSLNPVQGEEIDFILNTEVGSVVQVSSNGVYNVPHTPLADAIVIDAQDGVIVDRSEAVALAEDVRVLDGMEALDMVAVGAREPVEDECQAWIVIEHPVGEDPDVSVYFHDPEGTVALHWPETTLLVNLVMGWNDACYVGPSDDVEDAAADLLGDENESGVTDLLAIYRFDDESQTFDRWFPEAEEGVNTIESLEPYDQLFVLMEIGIDWLQEITAAPASADLVEGWSDVCYPGASKPVEDATANIIGDFEILYSLGSDQLWRRFVPGRADITNIVTLNQYTSVFLLVTVEGGSTWIFDP